MTKKKTLVEQIETEHTEPVKTKGSTRRKSYVMDLRVHSPASLGYLGIDGIDTAPAMVRLAKVKGLDVIAVTDYYSGDFIDRVADAAKDTALTVLPGTVIRCAVDGCNDVVLLCLFPDQRTSDDIRKFLLALELNEEDFGNKEHVLDAPMTKILEVVDTFEGIAIPSRMDKMPYRMNAIHTLVEEYGFRAFDLAYSDSSSFFKEHWPKMDFQLFSFSSANALAQVGSRHAKVKMHDPGFTGLKDIVARAALSS